MKITNKMSRAVSQLEHIYSNLNADFFQGALPVPIITVQSKPGTMGHCSVAKVWRRTDEHTYELNIAAEVLNYPIEETLDMMDITKKWTGRRQDWSVIHAQLAIYFAERMPE